MPWVVSIGQRACCAHTNPNTHTHPRHTAVEGSMAHKSHRIRVDFFFELVGAFQRVFKGSCAQHSWSSASGERLEISWGFPAQDRAQLCNRSCCNKHRPPPPLRHDASSRPSPRRGLTTTAIDNARRRQHPFALIAGPDPLSRIGPLVQQRHHALRLSRNSLLPCETNPTMEKPVSRSKFAP